MKINLQDIEFKSFGEAGFAESALGQQLRMGLRSGSAGQRQVADVLLRNPVRAAAWGIEELAAQAQTSTATVSRFATQIGFSGYAALRAALAQALQDSLAPAYQPVEKLRGAVQRGHASPSGEHAVIQEGLDATLGNLHLSAQRMQAARLLTLAQRLTAAPAVYTMGFGLSAHLAGILALHLQPFCPQMINVVEYGGTEVAAGRLMNIQENDVLIAIAFPRYAKDAPLLAGYARERGAHVVALTDSMASPLAEVAHDTWLASAVHPVLSSSSSAALLMIEALASALMLSRGAHVEQAGKLTQAIWSYLHQDTPPKRTRR